jgi:ATP-binding cassette subfamily F protein 3
MIGAQNISLIFGQQVILNNQTFTILPHQKLGLVGRNGAGKSTLLKIIAGMQNLDEGSITIDKGRTIAYMPQELVMNSDKNILDEALSTFAILIQQKAELDQLEELIHHSTTHIDDHDKLERYAHLQEHFSHSDYAAAQVETKRVLIGLGFKEENFGKAVAELSLGWRMRLVLAKLLLQKADFYLFDEPTNHLDIVAKDWFLEFLKNSKTGFLFVSHDRYFLDHACEQILEIERGILTFYRGNYSSYLTQKEERVAVLEKMYEEQQREIGRKERTIERFKAKASKAGMAQSMMKQLEKMELIELPPSNKDINIVLPQVQQPGKIVLTIDNVSKTFGHNTIFKGASFEVARGEKVALVAANGMGKSTLFNLITGKYPLEGGTVKFGHNVTVTLFEQDQDKSLNKLNTILQEIEAVCKDSGTRALVRTLLGSFLFPGDDVYKRISVLSGGEKNRVAMVKVLLSRANFMLLDEPTNHLDLQSKEILLKALQQFNGTLLFVSHDRTFLDDLATRILELTPTGVRSYTGNYESYLYQKAQYEKNLQTKESAAASQQRSSSTSKKSVPELSGREAYEQRKRISSLERTIEKLEKKIADLYAAQGTQEYGSAEHTTTTSNIASSKKQLDAVMDEWLTLTGGEKV